MTETKAPVTNDQYATREEWLGALVACLQTWEEFDGVDNCRISVGFPSTGRKSKRIGECHYAAEDGLCQLFIHPMLATADEVAHVVAHELVHVKAGVEAKHGPRFAAVAKGIGLTGKMTATVAGPEFVERIADVLADLGPYPHGRLGGASTAPPKQTTRQLKVACDCGYTVRMTRKWLDEVGAPACPRCDVPMVEA